MESMTLSADNPPAGFIEARRQAVGKANELLSRPVIVAWKDDKAQRFGPEIPGGSEDRWHDYGENYGGVLELMIGDNFHFIFTEASDFEEPDLNIASISAADGTIILCLNDACTEQDREQLGYFAGGGIGG